MAFSIISYALSNSYAGQSSSQQRAYQRAVAFLPRHPEPLGSTEYIRLDFVLQLQAITKNV